MDINIDPHGIWYHGSNKIFDILDEGSTVTQRQELAEAFSHKPSLLYYTKKGKIRHNGRKQGYLYIIDEPVIVGENVYPHPRTSMEKMLNF